METRTCKTCQASKPLECFHSQVAGNGKRYWKHSCAECLKAPAKLRKQAWYLADPGRARAASAAYYRTNRAQALSAMAAYRETRPEWWREYHRQWRAANRPKIVAWVQMRNAAKLRAIPAWADSDKIVALYVEAQRRSVETGVEHHVDHSVPLRSPLVCGLHVEHNLAVMPAAANLEKGNRRWPDMP